MSFITLLFLYCLAFQSDYSHASNSFTMWQCYSEDNPCRSNFSACPVIRNESSRITVEDLPTENVPIAIEKLLSMIVLLEPNTSYGLLVLEAGDNSQIEWNFSTLFSSYPFTSSYATKPPLMQELFARDLPIYHFSAAAYEGSPAKVAIVSPDVLLSFTRKDPAYNLTSCQRAALIFAIVKWTREVAQNFVGPVSSVIVSECEICIQLPISSEFIRLCPPFQFSEETAKHRGQLPSQIAANIREIFPKILDISASSHVLEASIEVKDIQLLTKLNCSLVSSEGVPYPLKTELSAATSLMLTLMQKLEADTFMLECWFTFTDEQHVKTLFEREITAVDYKLVVEIEHGSVAVPCAEAVVTVTATFKHSLPKTSKLRDGNSYCWIGNATYPGSLMDLHMNCSLYEMTRIQDTYVYFVRSPTLHTATLQNQVPIKLQMACEETTSLSPRAFPLNESWTNLTAILSKDLLGIVISSSAHDAFPVGLIACRQVIVEYAALGGGAVCIGDGDNLAVRFGTAAAIRPAGVLTVNRERLILEVPDTVIHPNFTLSAPSEVMACMEDATVEVKQITGDGGRPLRYIWQTENASVEIVNLLSSTATRSALLPSKLITSEIAVTVTVCNFVNKCTTSKTVHIRPVKTFSTLSLSLGSSVSQTLLPSMAVRLKALPQLTRCNSSITLVPNDAQYSWFLNDHFMTNDDSYRIPAYTYQPGDSVKVLVEVNYKDAANSQHLHAAVEETLSYIAEKLVVTVDAVSRSIASDAPALIDATGSRNPNQRDGSVTHTWSCFNMTSLTACNIPSTIETKTAVLHIPPGILNPPMSFNFSDTVRAQNLSNVAWSLVTMGVSNLPQIKFSPLSKDQFGIIDYIRIQAYVTVHQGWLNTTWEVVRTVDTSFFELSSFLANPNTTFTRAQMSQSNQAVVSLTIPPVDTKLYPNWTGLHPGMQYTIRLNACSEKGTSFADVRIVVNAPPSIGTIEVLPTEGAVALSTQVEFRVGDGWQDDDQPLQYRFGLKTHLADNSSKSFWFPLNGVTSQRTYLPSAQQSTPSCGNRVGFRALLEVCDHYSLCSRAETAIFEVLPPPNLTVAMVDMVAAINSDIGNAAPSPIRTVRRPTPSSTIEDVTTLAVY